MSNIDIATLRRIRKAVMTGKRTKKEVAEKYGVSVSTVMRIAKMSDEEFEEYIQRKKEQQKRAKKKCKS